MTRPAAPPPTFLEGRLERVTFFNPETRYTIGRLKTTQTKTRVTVVGYMAPVSPGETLKLQGEWEVHPRYGQQFRILSCSIKLPASIGGIRKYLGSGIIKGIGPQMARRLVDRFGVDTFEVIEKSPERLMEIEGIGRAKSESICSEWETHHTFRRLMDFLEKMVVKPVFGARIFKIYGPDAESILRDSPYRLARDLPGPGFEIGDAIARNMDVAGDDPERAKACLAHVLSQAANEGHVFVHEDYLIDRCERVFEIAEQVARDALSGLESLREVVVESISDDPDARVVYSRSLHRAETGFANRLKALLSVPAPAPEIDTDRIAEAVSRKLAIKLSGEQLHVLEEICSLRAAIITGGPGTGKTTLLRSITAIFEALGRRVLLAAPTGRAARRLAEVTGRKASTIHRLLGYTYNEDRFEKNETNPLDADAVIVDEASMVDTLLMFHLMQAVPMTSALVLVGDVFQLPSVGPGNVLSDLIESQRVPVFYLKEIYRQAQESPITVNAHRVRSGKPPDLSERTLDDMNGSKALSEFYFLEQQDPKKLVSLIVELCTRTIPESFGYDPINDIQVLTPMHRGLVGTINLNQVLQSALNPNPIFIDAAGGTFKTGDKVMHLRNNYQKEVFNGDIGLIREIDKKDRFVLVDFYGRTITYDFAEMDEIAPAYAVSVHKSQGSEYPAVIVPLTTQHFPLLQRNLLYTALTRGKKLVILTGSKKAVEIALQNDKPGNRLSGLAARLRKH